MLLQHIDDIVHVVAYGLVGDAELGVGVVYYSLFWMEMEEDGTRTDEGLVILGEGRDEPIYAVQELALAPCPFQIRSERSAVHPVPGRSYRGRIKR